MSHTNSTTNYSLPQFVTTDKPAWLTDINGAFSAIDTAIKSAADDASTAGTNASQALLDAGAAGTAASAADAKASGAIDSIADAFSTSSTYSVGDMVMYNSLLYKCTTAVNTPGAWTGVTNWTRATAEDLIGNLNSLTTVHKNNLVAAVNDAYDLADANKTAIDDRVSMASFSFNKEVPGSSEVSFGILRSDFNLPANTQVVDCYLRLNNPANVNAGFQYSLLPQSTSTTAVLGSIYNSTNSARTYAITAVVFYKNL